MLPNRLLSVYVCSTSNHEEYQAQGVIHPNGPLDTKPWGTKEFGVLDPTGVCITFYEPVTQ